MADSADAELGDRERDPDDGLKRFPFPAGFADNDWLTPVGNPKVDPRSQEDPTVEDPEDSAAEDADADDWPIQEDPELSGIVYSLDAGLIYVEGAGWLEREDAETELGAERVAELARTQPAEIRDYLASRRGELAADDE